MRMLVTGGAGFIGSHTVDGYIEQGHDVVVIDDLSTGKAENVNQRASFVKIGIEDPSVEEIFREHNPEVLNHHAAQMDVRRSVENPLFDAGVNLLGTLNLLQNCVKYDVKKVVFASSGGTVYGEQEKFPADEEHPLKPLSPYGVSKLAGEKYLYFYKMAHGLEYTALRYANVYGPRQNPHGEAGVVAIFIQKLLSGEQPVINGDGLQTRDFVYVEDVAQANIVALEGDKSGEFNIGTGIETDINTIFRKLLEITGIDAEEVHAPTKPGEQQRSVIDNSKAREILNWSPGISLEDGLKKTVEFFQTRS